MDDQLAVVFEALGDPMRRRIVELLGEGPSPVGILAEQLPVGRPAVSRHLKTLTDAGLVSHRSAGTRNLYALAPEPLVAAQQWLVAAWDGALRSFADAAESAAAHSSAKARSTDMRPPRPRRSAPGRRSSS